MEKASTKSRASLLAASLLAFLFVSPIAKAQNVSFDASATWVSQYVWRGIQIYRTPGIEPGVEAYFDNLTVGWWSHIDWTEGEDAIVKEHDLYASYTTSLGDWEFSPYYIHYDFPNEVFDPSAEVGFTASKSIGEWDLGIDVSADIDAVKGGLFAGVSVSKSWEQMGVEKSLALSAGFWNSKSNNFNYGIDRATLNYFSVDYSLSKEIGQGITGTIGGTVYLYPTQGINAGGNTITGVLSIGVGKSF